MRISTPWTTESFRPAVHPDTLTPLDIGFLRLETNYAHLHIGAVAVFDGPHPPFAELKGLIARRWAEVPRAGQRVHELPLGLARPEWVDDAHFDPDNHITRHAVPKPGGLAELQELVGSFMSLPLDLHAPPWEIWVVEGLAGGRWAVVTKVHHSMADGIGGTDLLMRLFDEAETFAQLAAHPDGHAPQPVGGVDRLRRNVASLRPSLKPLRSAVEIGRLLVPSTGTTLAGSIGRDRTWCGSVASFDDLRLVRKAFGGSVNDVCLTMIAGGFRELLLHRRVDPAAHPVRTLVPVSIRAENHDGTFGNRVTALVAELPVGVEDPVERLSAVRSQLDRLKESGEATSAQVGLTLLMLVPPPAYNALAGLVFRLPQRIFATVTTNVPGPREPLHLSGRRLREMYPYVPIAFQLRTGIAMLSYNGSMYFGFTADHDSTPDLAVLVHGVDDALTELVKAAREKLGDDHA